MFAVATETGWPEEQILFMPLAKLAQYQHCLLRRNGALTRWSISITPGIALGDQLNLLRQAWTNSFAGNYSDSPPTVLDRRGLS